MPHLLSLLVVEDEVETRLLLSEILTMQGFEVRTAEEGFQALRMFRAFIPDILLSDLNMPGMSGFELLSVVRKQYPQIRVVATSGAYRGTQVPAGIAADAFYEKATGLARLFDVLAVVASSEDASIYSKRVLTPTWIRLESAMAGESNHVLLNCPQCLRAFRHSVVTVNADIRTADCRYCGAIVAYGIALAVKPPSTFSTSNAPLPSPYTLASPPPAMRSDEVTALPFWNA